MTTFDSVGFRSDARPEILRDVCMRPEAGNLPRLTDARAAGKATFLGAKPRHPHATGRLFPVQGGNLP